MSPHDGAGSPGTAVAAALDARGAVMGALAGMAFAFVALRFLAETQPRDGALPSHHDVDHRVEHALVYAKASPLDQAR